MAHQDRERDRRHMGVLLRDARTGFYQWAQPLSWHALGKWHGHLVNGLYVGALIGPSAPGAARKLKSTHSRAWFTTTEQWPTVATERVDPGVAACPFGRPVAPEPRRAPVPRLPVTECPDGRCALCGDRFRELCDDDDRWMLVNAVRAPDDGRVYHQECNKQ